MGKGGARLFDMSDEFGVVAATVARLRFFPPLFPEETTPSLPELRLNFLCRRQGGRSSPDPRNPRGAPN
eukprot:8879079-Pyramimonas_sp.AAC.1